MLFSGSLRSLGMTSLVGCVVVVKEGHLVLIKLGDKCDVGFVTG